MIIRVEFDIGWDCAYCNQYNSARLFGKSMLKAINNYHASCCRCGNFNRSVKSDLMAEVLEEKL